MSEYEKAVKEAGTKYSSTECRVGEAKRHAFSDGSSFGRSYGNKETYDKIMTFLWEEMPKHGDRGYRDINNVYEILKKKFGG